MNATSIDIKDMLEDDSSLGLTFATDLFVAKEPSSPDNCVTVIDAPSTVHLALSKNYSNYYYSSVQIRVRNDDFLTGWNLIQDITTLLHGRADEVWNSTYYTLINCTSGPAALQWDENERVVLIVNFDVQRRNN